MDEINAITVSLALTSGVVGAIATAFFSAWLTARQEFRRLRLDTFRRIAGWRFTLGEDVVGRVDSAEYFSALNEAAVVFHHAPRVIAALERMLEAGQGHEHENLVELLHSIMSDLHIRKSALSTQLLMRPFVPGPAIMRRQK